MVLVLTTITDEEDDLNGASTPGSMGGPAAWYADVLAAKGGREEFVVALSLIGVAEPNECSVTYPTGEGGTDIDGAEISVRIAEFTKMFGERGIIGDVCTDNYDPFFEMAVNVIELACDSLPEG